MSLPHKTRVVARYYFGLRLDELRAVKQGDAPGRDRAMRPETRRALAAFVPGVDRFGLVLVLLVLDFLVAALGGGSTLRLFEASFVVVALWLALHASATGPRVRLWAAAMFLAAFIAVVIITQLSPTTRPAG